MQTVLNTSHSLGPRKSASFLSLRKDKDRSPSGSSPSTPSTPSQSSFRSDSGSRQTNRATPPRPLKPKTSRRPSTALDSPQDMYFSHNESPIGPGNSYAFPSCDGVDPWEEQRTPRQSARTRSRTGPSGRKHWEHLPVPQLRFSGSSSTQHTETPPHTPIDLNLSSESLESFPVVVAAPIAGVETMDALVDGMNGGDELLSASALVHSTRFAIPGHHPLYQPPLPTPPPGITLGGGKGRQRSPINHYSSSESEEDVKTPSALRPRRRRPRPIMTRTASGSIPVPQKTARGQPDDTHVSSETTPTEIQIPLSEKRKAIVPTISEIIRNYAPIENKPRSHIRPSTGRSSSYAGSSLGHTTLYEYQEPDTSIPDDDADLTARSSIDSIAEEVQKTIRGHVPKRPTVPPSIPSFPNRFSVVSDNLSVYSPRSDPGASSPTVASSMYSIPHGSSIDVPLPSLSKPSSHSQRIAQYLRSTRITTLLRLTRSPHASQDCPLTVSLSDLGSPTGYPVLIFLGLGCVRHIMGLYDEMGEVLNLRLITIDRWGLGRTEPRSKSAKGISQWASVVDEVLDKLGLEECSVIAHSAGAPYALSFANMYPQRIRGDVCLLAPWVGGSESNGYKWLKYVPNPILKTAQAAEWKVQAWMLGKPPTISYEGIGYTPTSPNKVAETITTSPNSSVHELASPNSNRSRPSIGSSVFSEYDDLRDFDGRFESHSTLGVGPSDTKPVLGGKGRARGLLNRLRTSSQSPQSHQDGASVPPGKKLKGLRSMGSLKGKSAKSMPPPEMPRLPLPLKLDIGLGFNDLDWAQKTVETSSLDQADGGSVRFSQSTQSSKGPFTRTGGRRSISLTGSQPSTTPASPSFSASTSSISFNSDSGYAFQAALGNALLAASHAESAKGTYNDLQQILNHENKSWGFSYTSYPHTVKVWYGDKDEKIPETSMRWLKSIMGEDRCTLKIVRGAEHGLMYKASVVVEVLEHVVSSWRS